MSRAALWLFDIDGTLVDTGGAGLVALGDAAEEVFGDRGPALDLRGATDSGLLRDYFVHFGREANDEDRERFYAFYLRRLEQHLQSGDFPSRVLPGVVELLERVAEREEVAVGLLTGNIEEGAWLKVRHFGLERFFEFGAFGCEHADRNLLGPVALAKAAAHAGRSFGAEEIVVVGDTPKDIACAAAIGARCLAVATGHVPAADLRGAWRVVEDLSDPKGWADLLEGVVEGG
ncbi:phosphoglycolate phosphatase-like HAD superfamily hydrolase [Haloferula luteola]|uniref:phosphoglycolate phosphatase n=1 Tax=Haloferula luteola TaxID=595692 RepID=A0A840V287_9BACT|nr:HAD hydrolase-like protein [Haloferula luteola]MBB5351553.1 phosphoglycolate phosphatase-like HAD superfamily hydrolase [Haloferula luteola]